MGRNRKKKYKLLEQIEITGIADKGKSVGRTAEGQVVFVENVAPGDVVDVQVFKKRKGSMFASPKRFHTYSEDRVQPFCAHFGTCGGCRWQHVAYEAQIRHKEKVVRDALQRIAKIEPLEFIPIMGAEATTYYRNKLEFSFSNKKWMTRTEIDLGESPYKDVFGFHKSGAFDKIVDIDHCYLQLEPSNQIRNTIRKIAHDQKLTFYDAREHTGYLRNVVFRITELGQIMLIFSLHEADIEKQKPFLDEVLSQLPMITSLYFCINPKVNDFILDLDMHLYYGQPSIEEKLGDVRFNIGPKSFFQTNTRQAVRLFDVVKDFAGLTGSENVYDLYTGIGSIALYLAQFSRQVVGIEEIEAAIEDAKNNAALNEFDNTVFYAGDVKNILTTEFAQQHGKPDVLITDPPRAGMHADVVKMLLQLEAPKIVYVSCNPSTQARDLVLLDEKYRLDKIQPVDMFPHTHHIETVSLLTLKQ